MTDAYAGKRMTAEQALAPIRSGQHVVIGTGAAEPEGLVAALMDKASMLDDVELTHLMTLGLAPYAGPEFAGRLRHNALFIGDNVREAVRRGLADYTPCHLCDLPGLMRSGRLRVDVALISTTVPEGGFCSLGPSVDIIKAAVESARYVVALSNPRMPWTEGDTRVLIEDIDAFVEGDALLPELPRPEPTAASLWIGRYAARLIEDGSTLQVGAGAVPEAILAALGEKKDIGLHSELLTDAMLPLIEKGVINGARKTLHREKAVASICVGGRRLYEAVDRNQRFELRPIDYVNDPAIIARHERMVAINSALQVDLTGQVAADSLGSFFYSGVGGQADFMRGAARSRGGKSIIALPSTAKGGALSRIVACLEPGTGVTATRADVDFVVTEYGIASLKGKTIRERAVALISIAHPSFRKSLAAEAERLGFLDRGHLLPPDCGPYLAELEATVPLDGKTMFVRPIKPSDERALKDLFYAQSRRTTLMRYGIPLKRLTEEEFQRLVCIDFRSSIAVGVFVRNGGGRRTLVAVGRYFSEEGRTMAEAAITVQDEFQGQGIGTFLVDYLSYIAKERGLHGFRTEMAAPNPRMHAILERRFSRVHERDLGEDGVSLSVLFKDWVGQGNPARGRAVALRQP